MAKHLYWYYENVYSLKEIKKLNRTIEKVIKERKIVYSDNAASLSTKTSVVKVIPIQPIRHLLDSFITNAYEANEQNFNYHIYPLGLKTLNYNVYNPGTEYTWHVDKDNNAAFDMKLTCLLNCSEKPYKGGDFLLFEGKELKVPEFQNPGSMVIFHSPMNHKVTPVTSGQRKTLTLWLNGPKLQ